MPRFLVVLLVLGGLACSTRAQGFNAFSGRNHPELDWRYAETEHFRIMYPARLAGIEAEAAAVAEATYDVLSENLDVTFDERIRIYLSDEDEITNGFAVPVGNGYTNIWVHVNDAANVWTGEEKWLRKVVAHELVHLFHYRAVLTRPRLLATLFGDPLPRFWTEGLAQYETELWDAQRGDRWLRTAVLDDALSYEDGRSLWNGRLLYAVGNSQVRYFAEQYGDSTLARLLAHRRPALFGLAEVHDFGAAFEEVTGESYRDFYDDWRRHVNVYYNLIASQLETPDSLDADPLGLPGQYVFDVRYAPDTSRAAVLALTSLSRPVQRLYVVDAEAGETRVAAEGGIKVPVSWSPDGRRLAFARTARGPYGALVNDLFVVGADGDGLRRLTVGRRAASPSFSPDGRRLAFVGAEGGTANIYTLDLETGRQTQQTRFTGDLQILSLRWHPEEDRVAFARFTPEGRRDVAVLDLVTGDVEPVTPGTADDRDPVWSPDGRRLAYTSLRDEVPNVFVVDPAAGTHRRVTRLATGAAVHDWLPPDSAFADGRLAVVVHADKTGDDVYRLDAGRSVPPADVDVPDDYAGWTTHRPPVEVPGAVAPDAGLVTARGPYRSWRNVTHAASLVFPYYGDPGDWGLAGMTVWLEPLGKHMLLAAGGVSAPDPYGDSYLVLSYLNNQWHPTVGVSAYRLPGSVRFYGSDLLVENLRGGDVTMQWPLDWRSRPFVTTTFGARLRYVDIDPLNPDDFEAVDGLTPPAAGQQADLQLSLTRRKQRPYRHNVVHPLDGLGLRLEVTGALPALGADSRFLRGDVAAFGIFRSIGLHRLYVYGHAQAQTGEPFPQDFVGLARRDDVQIGLPDGVMVDLGDSERVRGYRAYALGDRMLFGTVEYRMPLLSSLQTRLLGLVGLGATTLAFFTDAGLVWSGADLDEAVDRVGVGAEVKNALRLGGFFELAHAVGVAQPAAALGSSDDYHVYYRVRAAVPF